MPGKLFFEGFWGEMKWLAAAEVQVVGIFWFMDHVGEGATRYQKFLMGTFVG